MKHPYDLLGRNILNRLLLTLDGPSLVIETYTVRIES